MADIQNIFILYNEMSYNTNNYTHASENKNILKDNYLKNKLYQVHRFTQFLIYKSVCSIIILIDI